MPATWGCNTRLTPDGLPAFNFDARVNMNDGSCAPVVHGCVRPYATNHRENHQVYLLSRGRPTASSSIFSAETVSSNGVDGDHSTWYPNIFFSGGPGTQWWSVHLAFRTRDPDVVIVRSP